MKEILVPVDFSENSINAFKVAYEIAKITGEKILLFNVFQIPIDPSDIGGGVAMQMADSLEEGANNRLMELANYHNPSPEGNGESKVVVQHLAKMGFPAEEIIKMSSDHGIRLIIMGTTGEHGAFDKWLGSVSSMVSQKSECPVFLVPKSWSYKPIKKMVYAANYDSADKEMLDIVADWAHYWSSSVEFLHINQDPEDHSHIEESYFDYFFRKEHTDIQYKTTTMEKTEAVWDTLIEYGKENDIDMIVLVTHKRDFWTNLFHRSVTKHLALAGKLPILILHSSKKE